MKFSLVIPTFNNLPELKACLSALEAQESRDFEVWVCVDGSTDGSLEWLSACRPSFPLEVLIHPGNQNRGRAATRNLALNKIRGEFVLFLDSDMRPKSNFLLAHEKVVNQKACISLGSVTYLNRDENPWARYIGERGIAKYSQGEETPFHYFITPNTCLPAGWWKEAGGFDERISGYGGEDMELGYRLQLLFSPRFMYNPAAEVETVQEKGMDEALAQLHEYGKSGLPFLVQLHPPLIEVYHLKKCISVNFSDMFFEWLTTPFIRFLARAGMPLLPWPLKKQVMNYLVIAWIHQGFREGYLGLGMRGVRD